MCKPKITWDFIAHKGREDEDHHHFFASSVASWRIGTDLPDLISQMQREGFMFNIWLVPLPESAPYGIEYYSPKVDGAVWLGALEPVEGA